VLLRTRFGRVAVLLASVSAAACGWRAHSAPPLDGAQDGTQSSSDTRADARTIPATDANSPPVDANSSDRRYDDGPENRADAINMDGLSDAPLDNPSRDAEAADGANATACTGCWDGTTCRPGTEVTACGMARGTCRVCNSGNTCKVDRCTNGVCTSENLIGTKCATGVCADGTCRCGGPSEPCCGQNPACQGALVCAEGRCGDCRSNPSICDAGQACVTGACVCNESSCPNGCCSGSKCIAGTASIACGKAGGTCATCSTSQVCQSGACVTPKKARGIPCSSPNECASGNCVEGVCCDGPCSGRCFSCLVTNTGATDGDGHCAPVRAGLPHGTDCSPSTPESCGLDGKCDGTGACRKYAAGTVCGSETCPQGTSTHTPTPKCDGNGTCVRQSESCMNYQCNSSAARCKTICANSATDCVSTTYCNGSSCVLRKAAGQVCSDPRECASDLCGGRCCHPGVACTCTQPSAGNLLKNAGFDLDLAGWSVTDGQGTIEWTNDMERADFEKCPFSGGARIDAPANSASRKIEQCVAVAPSTTHYFNARLSWFALSGASAPTCEVLLFDLAGCAGGSTLAASIQWMDLVWGPTGPPKSFVTSAATASAKVSCSMAGGGTFGASAWVDFLHVGR
jgi:hypothetical protein